MPTDKVENIQKAYGLLEAVLKDHDYLVGNSLTLADISSIATISVVAEAGGIVPIDADKLYILIKKKLLRFFIPKFLYFRHPKLLAWMEKLSKLPYYPENKEGADELLQLFKDKYASNQASK
jgi:glutathione S-transferase